LADASKSELSSAELSTSAVAGNFLHLWIGDPPMAEGPIDVYSDETGAASLYSLLGHCVGPDGTLVQRTFLEGHDHCRMILDAQQYHDRVEGGRVLARQLAHYASRVDTLVLAVPRGGIPIALEVASYLNAPMDAFVTRTLALAGNPDVPLGAVAPGGVSVYDEGAIACAGVTPAQIAAITAQETAELERCQRRYREHRSPPHIAGRVVILVDDGLPNGLAMHAAVIALHRQQPAWLVVAAPVGSVEACEELAQEVHEVVCPFRPVSFCSTNQWYDHSTLIEDDTVRAALRRTAGLARA
jgi:putative phosphoribosyl transferase